MSVLKHTAVGPRMAATTHHRGAMRAERDETESDRHPALKEMSKEELSRRLALVYKAAQA
jgi:hypothetical protein